MKRRGPTPGAGSPAPLSPPAAPTRPPERGRHGGYRPGAGRKPNPDPTKRKHPHRARPVIDPWQPMQVILRVTPEVGALTRRSADRAIRRAAAAVDGRADFRIISYALDRDQVRVECAAAERLALANGMRAFCISAARHLNEAVTRDRRLDPPRRGRVFIDRYRATPIAGAVTRRRATRGA